MKNSNKVKKYQIKFKKRDNLGYKMFSKIK